MFVAKPVSSSRSHVLEGDEGDELAPGINQIADNPGDNEKDEVTAIYL